MTHFRAKGKDGVMRRVLLLTVVMLSAASQALAAPDADAILKRMFENYRARTSVTTVAMTIHRPAWERTLQLSASTRGEDDALVRFTAPAKDAGNATLKLGRETWVFNPRLNQVVKLPTSMLSQAWMGSDFSYDDLARSTDVLNKYTHRVVATASIGGHTVWTIDSVPKPGAPVVWGKVTASIRDDYVMTEETFYDQDMKPVRRMRADKVGDLGGRTYPLVMTMVPLASPGQWTRVETTSGQFNVAAPDYLFTLSNLQNPRR
jgi:outer membrane lipoprotein-sorting protein